MGDLITAWARGALGSLLYLDRYDISDIIIVYFLFAPNERKKIMATKTLTTLESQNKSMPMASATVYLSAKERAAAVK